jgi:formylglycine-generating enzyme required for sulfatase activity
MVAIPGGTFWMGSNDPFAYPQDGEGPRRQFDVSPFWIDACAVTNGRFRAFVDDFGYVTEAERFGWSFVFAGLLPEDFPPTQAVAQAPWWRRVDRADWRRPEGPHSSVAERLDHPVVHVSWNDAVAYCEWARGRLPPHEPRLPVAPAPAHPPRPRAGGHDELDPRHLTLETMSALAVLADRGEAPTVAALAAEIRAQRDLRARD